MEPGPDAEEGLHEHCLICINMRCQVRPYFAYACGMVSCPSGCGARYHRCKQTDHENLCPDEVVWCLNHWNGCSKRMARKKLKHHFPSCPARNAGYADGVQFVSLIVGNRGNRVDPAPAPSYQSGGSNPQEPSQNEDNDVTDKSPLWVVPWQQIDLPPEIGTPLDNDDTMSSLAGEPLVLVSASWQELCPTDKLGISEDEEKKFYLELLPFIVQRRIVEYLDAPSLRNLSLVSHKMRSLCAHMLREVGAVTLLWEKRDGKWVDAKRIWKF